MMSQRITSSRPCFVARTCVNHDLRRGKKCVCRMSQSNTPSQVDRCKPMQWLAGSAAALVLGSCCLSPGQALADFSSADTSSAIIQIVTGVNTVNAEENEVIRRESEAAQAENDVCTSCDLNTPVFGLNHDLPCFGSLLVHKFVKFFAYMCMRS